VGGQGHASVALPPGKTPGSYWYWRQGGLQVLYGRVRKLPLPPGCDRWTVQPVASRYPDFAMFMPSCNNDLVCSVILPFSSDDIFQL
jgi:hypothetical protein